MASARQVLLAEAQALDILTRHIPPDLEYAVETILTARGRVIVSGIGKSGHIGRKISATLASTGTPSHFVHAAEASHGDMGTITPDDVCLLLSNSGETAELRDILAYTRRFSIPLIAISSRPHSTIMRSADYRLALPAIPEACPNGMAPTTSTTMMIALGDALAIALMEARGFAPEDFRDFHPGGQLGAQMARVDELMHRRNELPLVRPETPMSEVLLTMSSKGFGIAIVVDGNGRLTGVITDGDLRRNMTSLMERTAGQVATTGPTVIQPDLLAVKALALMNQRKISALPVVDIAGCPVGILHIHDLLRAGVA
ncbi:KpsF/GutQ family protein [Sphingobium jiangsuense]|uniref:Arabinose-5-phosphate isomerase n=1 Tax=Sphingobium jiangsuense TaxID=870476 RepID=A0A7W6FQ36_9SPHN|nr:KpsF/GutQ family sugar-phosphate isomerase [Sphingobium jiangsuense]MBB3926262.1 arabinose-5-phosphate isomerase [Sphingobium jiangsuense]GLS99976.1 KpsF/GutQ family protein [Sphingobium jiangsuense]